MFILLSSINVISQILSGYIWYCPEKAFPITSQAETILPSSSCAISNAFRPSSLIVTLVCSFYRPDRKDGECTDFTGVCLFTPGGGVTPSPAGVGGGVPLFQAEGWGYSSPSPSWGEGVLQSQARGVSVLRYIPPTRTGLGNPLVRTGLG